MAPPPAAVPALNPSSAPPNPHTPEAIALRADLEVPPLLLPDPKRLFGERALRLRQLAAGHAMRDYLMLLAVVCEAQHAQAQLPSVLALPTPAQRDNAAQVGAPVFDATRWPRDPQWRSALRAIGAQVLERLPRDSPARTAVQSLSTLADDALELQADRLLAGITLGLDMALAPLVAAGLQLYFSQLVAAGAAAQPNLFAVAAKADRCPCCGSLPVASLTRLGGQQEGQRYQHCTLCSAQWHSERIRCTRCQATEGIHYLSLEAVAASPDAPRKRPAVEAETCDACGHYLKILHAAVDLHSEPVADDLASLTLDLLVADAGFVRHGTNLLLLFGDAEASGS